MQASSNAVQTLLPLSDFLLSPEDEERLGVPFGEGSEKIIVSEAGSINKLATARISNRDDNVINAIFRRETQRYKLIIPPSGEKTFWFEICTQVMTHFIKLQDKRNFELSRKQFLQEDVVIGEAASLIDEQKGKPALITQWVLKNTIGIGLRALIWDFLPNRRGIRPGGREYRNAREIINNLSRLEILDKKKGECFRVFNECYLRPVLKKTELNENGLVTEGEKTGRDVLMCSFSSQMNAHLYQIPPEAIHMLESDTMIKLDSLGAKMVYAIFPKILFSKNATKENPLRITWQRLAEHLSLPEKLSVKEIKRRLGVASNSNKIKNDFFSCLQSVKCGKNTIHAAPCLLGKKDGLKLWLEIGESQNHESLPWEKSLTERLWRETIHSKIYDEDISYEDRELIMKHAKEFFDAKRKNSHFSDSVDPHQKEMLDEMDINIERNGGAGNALFLYRALIGGEKFNETLHTTKAAHIQGEINGTPTEFLIASLKNRVLDRAKEFVKSELLALKKK